MGPRFTYFETPEALAKTLANETAELIKTHITATGHADIIVPGGSSPKAFLKALAAKNLLWEFLTICPSDERKVPLETPDNNASMIAGFWKSGPDILDLQKCDEMKIAALRPSITILGMGMDGHFASLFNEADTARTDTPIFETTAPNPPHERISLGLKRLCESEKLVLILPDEQKTAYLQSCLTGSAGKVPVIKLAEKAGDTLEIYCVNGA